MLLSTFSLIEKGIFLQVQRLTIFELSRLSAEKQTDSNRVYLIKSFNVLQKYDLFTVFDSMSV